MKHVIVAGDNLNQAVKFALENCKFYHHCDHHMSGYNLYEPNRFDFFFEDDGEAEMTMFALRFESRFA